MIFISAKMNHFINHLKRLIHDITEHEVIAGSVERSADPSPMCYFFIGLDCPTTLNQSWKKSGTKTNS